MIVTSQPALARDLGYLAMIEAKATDYPLSQDAVKLFVMEEDKHAFVASISNRKVGIALTFKVPDEEVFVIARVSVHPDFRLLGVSKSLLGFIDRSPTMKNKLLRMFIPNYKVDDPTDPDYIGGWLNKMGFSAVGCETDMFFRYGRDWDAYIFERSL